MPSSPALDTNDIQGLVARGYSHLKAARYTLLRIIDVEAARKWLSAVAVSSAADRDATSAVNVALTARGLSILGLDPGAIDQFDPGFLTGMTDPTKSRLLGDVGPSAPESWSWGGGTNETFHLMVMTFAVDDGALASAHASLAAEVARSGLADAGRLETDDHGDREPFGFHDSISQPLIEGLSKTGPAMNTVRAGEFILGYRNEYGLYTDRPILPGSASHADQLPRDQAGSGGYDLGRNGCYLVMRTLRQDVFRFWEYLDSVTRRTDGSSDPAAQNHLGARIVGRWPGGAPLVLCPEHDDLSLADSNSFTYHDIDASGMRCPIGAHIRRSNPRDSLDPQPGSQASIAVGKRHRILRRGREYGPAVTAEARARGVDDGVDRGLHFACLCGNLGRQFEFIQHTWINNPKFSGFYNDPDPLVAGRHPGADCFTIPGQPIRTRLTSLPAFVTVQGGAYFFLPGLRALRYIARAGT
jgi:Dyp-type peroxidase family